MYQIRISRVFSAAHAIRLYDGALEPVHGHDWRVEVVVASDELDEIEVVMDFHALEKSLDALIAKVHNRHLNEVAPFAGDERHAAGLAINPTAERVAWWIGSSMAATLPAHVRLVQASVTEAPGCQAVWIP